MKAKKENVWIVTSKNHGAYVDFRFTKRDMIRHHCETLGYVKWKDAYAKGDRCVKATIKYNL